MLKAQRAVRENSTAVRKESTFTASSETLGLFISLTSRGFQRIGVLPVHVKINPPPVEFEWGPSHQLEGRWIHPGAATASGCCGGRGRWSHTGRAGASPASPPRGLGRLCSVVWLCCANQRGHAERTSDGAPQLTL